MYVRASVFARPCIPMSISARLARSCVLATSACFCVVEKSHCVHLCGLSPVCVSLWFSIDVHLEVAKLHCLMSALEWLFSKVRGNMIFQVLLSFC